MMFPNKLTGKILTVLIRDDTPMIHCNDTPAYRSVRIELTDEQREQIALRATGSTSGNPIYEAISKCWLEEV